MKKRVRYTITAMLAAVFASPLCYADNLIEIYRQALKSDPTFKAAEAQYLATREVFPISQAALLPSIVFSGAITKQHVNPSGEATESGFSLGQFPQLNALAQAAGISPTTVLNNGQSDPYYNTVENFSLNATQAIFNYANWMTVRNAVATVKQAEATYFAAAQDLMVRTATAYFNVLLAYYNLTTVQSQKEALAKQLEQTEQQFKVGLIAITGVEQTKASYDAIVAQEISAKVNVAFELEQLRAITGVLYPSLATFGKDVPLVHPVPDDINRWVEVAIKQNYTLVASNFAVVAARENVKVTAAQHLPTVNATAGFQVFNNSNLSDSGTFNQDIATVGVTLNMPVYQGGLINSQTRQASYLFAQSAATREETYRTTMLNTRQAFLGVIAGINKVIADKQAVVSNTSALEATQAGYTVGTQTIVDVLTQQSNLFQAQLTLVQDQYNYIISTLQLKQAAGTLSADDLAVINCWLGQELNLRAYNSSVMQSSTLTDTRHSSLSADIHQINVNVNTNPSSSSSTTTAPSTTLMPNSSTQDTTTSMPSSVPTSSAPSSQTPGTLTPAYSIDSGVPSSPTGTSNNVGGSSTTSTTTTTTTTTPVTAPTITPSSPDIDYTAPANSSTITPSPSQSPTSSTHHKPTTTTVATAHTQPNTHTHETVKTAATKETKKTTEHKTKTTTHTAHAKTHPSTTKSKTTSTTAANTSKTKTATTSPTTNPNSNNLDNFF
jgi:outer membrane protein